MTRVAVYARYSSDNQREASIEDQIRVCRDRADREGWRIVQTYTDFAISGASMLRPGIQALMQDAMAGKVDLVLAEDLDRLSRDQEDIAGFYKRMEFSAVKIVTLADGEISDLHVGLKGTMAARYLKDLAHKTHRGLRGRVEAGKSGGGKCYGYDVLHSTNGKGETVRGDREINDDEARIVNRIFEDYAAGISPKAIAVALNKESIPGPAGKAWGPSTIYGNRRRGTGILNNELYIGRLVWNRLKYVKDPDTGKRVSRLNPEEDWIVTDVPELRLVDPALWEKVKRRQKALDAKPTEFWGKQRPQNLFSFLLKCGFCGGGYSKVSKSQYGCSNASKKGTCDNRLTISQNKLEHAVLDALQDNLMDPELCAVFCEEYTNHVNRRRMEHNAARNRYQAELEKLAKEREKLIQAIKDGVPGGEVKSDFERIVERREELESILESTEEAPALLHPSMAERYRQEVSGLVSALNDEKRRTEAAELLRSLIEKIVLKPNQERNELLIDLYGDLAGILTLAVGDTKKAILEEGFLGAPAKAQDKMVAGAGFEPATFRL